MLFFYFDEDNGEVVASAKQMNLFLHDSDDNIRYNMMVLLAPIKRKTNTIETKIKKYGNDENKTAKSDLPAAKAKFVLYKQ